MTRSALPAALAAVAALSVAVGAAPRAARADDGAPAAASASPCEVFRDVVARARRSGALGRVLGQHPFTLVRRFSNDDGTPRGVAPFLMTYDVALVDTADVLTVAVHVWDPSMRGGVHIRYDVSTRDGRLVRLESDAGGQDTAAWLEPREAGADLVVTISGEPTMRWDWQDAYFPKIVLAFVLPMLHDQGVPPALEYRDLNPFGQRARPATFRRAPAAGGDGADGGPRLAFESLEGRPDPTTVVEVERASGQVVSIRTASAHSPDGRHVTHLAESQRLAPAEFERLRASGAPLDIR